jgi:hypothetical protein
LTFITTFINIRPLHNSTSNFITKIFLHFLLFSLLLSSSSSVCSGQLAGGRGSSYESRVEGRHRSNTSLHAPEAERHRAAASRVSGLGGGVGWRRRRGPVTAWRAEADVAWRTSTTCQPHGFGQQCLGSGRRGHDSAHGRWRVGCQWQHRGRWLWRHFKLCKKWFKVRRPLFGVRGKA